MQDDLREEKRNAHEHRAVIHKRIDEQSQQISHLETTVAIRGEIDAQLRDQIMELKETVEKNHAEVEPAIRDMERMKTLGLGVSGIIAFSGLTIGGLIAWMGDTVITAIRHWLKIN